MLESFNFTLPDGLIAQVPARPRDHARLLVYDRERGAITDSVFYELGKFLPSRTTLVLNNSKVEECRYLFPGNIEVFALKKLDNRRLVTMVRPGRKFKLGSEVALAEGISAKVRYIDAEGLRTLELNIDSDAHELSRYQHIPLPPYIAQNDALAKEYQNVYAKPLGSKAAPTAGLHFTESLLRKIQSKHDIVELTLHVGLGTFAPLKEENLKSGRLHTEEYEITSEAASALNNTGHITAVGTTTVRTLESNCRDGVFTAKREATDIFIRPGYTFKAVNSMVTNFHLPGTSLLMLVAAFIADGTAPGHGVEELRRVYAHAINEKYRFYSFGDAMLIV